MEEDVVSSSNEPAESSRLEDTSLADEITSQLDNMFKSTSQQPKPIRPPKPSSIKEFDNTKRPEGEKVQETEEETAKSIKRSQSHGFLRKRNV